MMTYPEKLAAIRQQMKEDGASAYIIPSADPHMNEYLPEHYKCLEFASGFTGSAGTLVITAKHAGLWTDGRYFVQANEQLKGTGFELMKLQVQHAPEYIAWLGKELSTGETVAYDGRLVSVLLAQLLQKELFSDGIKIKGDRDYLDKIWKSRPELPLKPAFLLSEKETGKSTVNKLADVRAALKEHKSEYHLISSLDDIAWLFNIRGADVKCNPVVLSYALISENTVELFIHPDKLSTEEKQSLVQSGVEILGYDKIYEALKSLPENTSIFIDPKRNCQALFSMLPQKLKVIQGLNPTTQFKALKNETEAQFTRNTMIKDGVALTKFFKWLEENIDKERITELSLDKKLHACRAEQDGFVGESFDTIAGYKAHGALPHYKATADSDVELKADGLFLLDSGGQYRTGTTDITRMMTLGNLSEEEKTDYTLVLKGMIDGSTTRFPKGSRGYQIDAITRKPLWDHARNYGHGTGHGVGFFLNVHEGPQVLNPTNLAVDLDLGMISSVEPGLYRPGKYGIRIENLVLTVPDISNEFAEFYAFETLTLCFIDTRPVNKDLLEVHHVEWLNSYHQLVYDKLSPGLNEEEKVWLKGKTKAI